MNNQNRIDRLFYMLDVIEREAQQLKKDLFHHRVYVRIHETVFGTMEHDANIIDVFEDYGAIFYKVQIDSGSTMTVDSRNCVLLENDDAED